MRRGNGALLISHHQSQWGSQCGSRHRIRSSSPVITTFFLVGFLLLVMIGTAGAQRTDPGLGWREIATQRFRVVFPAHLREVAYHTARIADEMLPALEEFLDSRLPYRPVIVLRDENDAPGGYADPLYGEIHFQVAEPFDLTFGPRYESWVKLVLAHELVHLVHLGAVGPGLDTIRQVLGYIILPNLIQPLWVWEGYAMYGESEHGRGERVGNPMYDMYLRDVALRDDFIPRHLLSGYSFLDQWPGRMGVYVYGSSAVRFIAEHYGEEMLAALSRERSQSLDPAGFERIFQGVLGKTVDEVWEEWQEALRHSAEETARRVQEQPLTGYRILAGKGFYSRNPSLSPDERYLAYTLSHPWYLPGIRLFHQSSGRERFLVRGSIGSRPIFSPDGRYLVYAKIASARYTNWYDLYLFDFSLDREQRLTWNERAFSPVFRGDDILYLRRNQTPETLVERSIHTGETRVLFDFPADFRPLHLAAHPDQPMVAVSGRWRGRLVLALLHPAEGEMRWVTTMSVPDPVPSFSPDGRKLVFSDAHDGIFNVYAYELHSGTVFQLTNLLGGAFEPVMGDDFLYASFYQAEGYYIGALPLDQADWSQVPWPEQAEPAEVFLSGRELDQPLYPESAYRGFASLAPRYWLPSLEGITLTGRDPLGFHAYSLGVEFLGEPLAGFFSYRGAFMVPEIDFTLQFEGEKVEWRGGVSLPLELGQWERGNLGIGYRRVWREDDLYGGFWAGVVATIHWNRSGGNDRWIFREEWHVTGRWGERDGQSERDAILSWQGAWQRAGDSRLRWDASLALGMSNREDFYILGGRDRFWGIAGYPEETMRGALAGRARLAVTAQLASFDEPLFELGVIKDLTGTLYLEGGMAGNDWSALETRCAVGGELTLRSFLAEELPVTLTLGCAVPFDRDLVAEWYLEVGMFFR